MPSDPPEVFISYSHADEAWKNRLVKQLKVLALEGELDVWDDRRIAAGDDWLREIETAMEGARAAIFLVSADFLTSKFIREQEVPRILERRGEGLRVIPVIVKSCPWRRVPWLASIQARPRDGQALELMEEPVARAALAELAGEIDDLLSGDAANSTPTIETASAKPRVSIARLPATGEHFVAREDELTRLDAAWDDADTNVIGFVAMGGVGKSALVNRWLDGLKADGWRGAERVLGWSFYSQGTEATGASSEAFTEYALDWLGYEGEIITSPWKKGEVIAGPVRAQRRCCCSTVSSPCSTRPALRRGGSRTRRCRRW